MKVFEVGAKLSTIVLPSYLDNSRYWFASVADITETEGYNFYYRCIVVGIAIHGISLNQGDQVNLCFPTAVTLCCIFSLCLDTGDYDSCLAAPQAPHGLGRVQSLISLKGCLSGHCRLLRHLCVCVCHSDQFITRLKDSEP